MRIAMVQLSPAGGLFQFGFQLGDALARRGHRVKLITGKVPELHPSQNGFELAPILAFGHPGAAAAEPPLLHRARRVARALTFVSSWARTVSYVNRWQADAFICVSLQYPEIAMPFIIWLARRNNAPILTVFVHEPRPLATTRKQGSYYSTARRTHRAFALTFKHMDIAFTLGENARQQLVADWPGLKRVDVVPHGNEEVFVRGSVRPASAAPPCVLFFGIWGRHKGLEVLLEAFALVSACVPSARLVIAGAVGGDLDASKIRDRAQEIPRVSLRQGYVPMEEVAPLFEEARVVAVPYLRANQSGVVHLAQTFARPVVATSVGDIPSAVTDGVTGLLVPPGDPRALARALERLLCDPETAARMGSAGRERISREASWEVVASRVERSLLDVRAGQNSSPQRDEDGSA